MTRRQDSGVQLSLDLKVEGQKKVGVSPSVAPPNVVAFVDAGTLAIRRDAIKRVQASGIFPAPVIPRLKA
ncbi:hypothetical protein MesoLj113a_37120 [Mesorhizobium sp. 113-1-2]|uniref:hypothetical protein n=1 Tax=Mesorhizobium sp. 113-1-2 TaxID=2744515 RepID=UPI001925E843|nr:hypothetical protein [Mesorhizobium sp. 113-1-2]BCG72554.1 hypothetical protein MesoLj113a_37120 [Mesorhizobium sp. 113-1-2]